VKGIKRVMRKALGATPVIQCSNGPFHKFQLFQIFVCVRAGDLKFIDCPEPPNYTCSREILFHPFEKWMLNKKPNNEAADPFELPIVPMDY
jgi:ribonuclease T2